jgi:PhnB protein
MEKVKLPQGYNTVMPYLVLNKAEDFFAFTKEVFDAREKSRHLLDDGSLMHGEVTIGESTIMFGNASDKWPVQNAGLYVNVADADVTFQKALDNGATLLLEVSNQIYGRSGGVTDPFGNVWWITTPVV